ARFGSPEAPAVLVSLRSAPVGFHLRCEGVPGARHALLLTFRSGLHTFPSPPDRGNPSRADPGWDRTHLLTTVVGPGGLPQEIGRDASGRQSGEPTRLARIESDRSGLRPTR